MSDASDTIRKRRQNALFASKVIAETYKQKGYTNHIVLDGGVFNNAMTYEPYHKMRQGQNITTVSTLALYQASIPNREPDPPTIAGVSATNGQATIYFTPPTYVGVSPVLYYRIRSLDGSIDITVTDAPAVVTGLASGTSYQFVMYAVNAVGSSVVSTASAATTVVGIPAAPTSVTGTPGTTVIDGSNYYSVSVAFTAPTFTGGAPIVSYNILSDPGFTDLSGSWSHGTGASSPIVMAGLTNGVAYRFFVEATNANGTSTPSLTFAGPFTPATIPDPPTNTIAIRGNTQAIVQFAAPLNNGGAAIIDYTATTSPGGFTATGASSPLTITGLTNGTAYTVTVRARNSQGSSIPSDASNSVTPATVPNPPTGVSASAGNSQAVVSFTQPANNGGSTVTSYTVTSSPGGLTAIGGGSPLTVLGLTNGIAYTFTVIATNGIGNSTASSASSPAVTPASGNRPGAPTAVSAVPGAGNTTATVSFTAPVNQGTPALTSYTITSNPGGFSTTTVSSPATVSGLTAGVGYIFSVVATNTVGNSDPGVSNQIIAGTPLAPVLTATSATVNDIIVTFSQTGNGTSNITNYRYSLNGGPFTAFSPADALSPVTISGLSSNTNYTIVLKAININGDSLSSNSLTQRTFTQVNTQTFTSSGSWSVPAGVTNIQYLAVGGGGGGGGCFSRINVLGDIPYLRSAPDNTSYWIMNNPGFPYNGYMMQGRGFRGANVLPSGVPIQMSVLAVANNSPPSIRPGTYAYNTWYAEQMVYRQISNGFPQVANYYTNRYTSAYCNTISNGGGGGAGGQVRQIAGLASYTLVNSTLNIVIGAGGAGGTSALNTENAGSPGTATEIWDGPVNTGIKAVDSLGGSGGGTSRSTTNNINGFNKGGWGAKYDGLYGGQGGQGAVGVAQEPFALVNSGGAGGQGYYLNYDVNGTKIYGAGGAGGIPNTPATGTTPPNLGTGGVGSGATLNRFANGIAGGSGVVILKWYT